jgi:hypothetical protein
VKVLKKFEENLEYLGFDLAPVAWDLARFKFKNDADRIQLLEEISSKKEATPSGGTQPGDTSL